MESWTGAFRLVVLMVVVSVCYLVGRWAAEVLRDAVASGAIPLL